MQTNPTRPVILYIRDRRTKQQCLTTIWVEAIDPRSDEQIRTAFKAKRALSLEKAKEQNKTLKLAKAFGPDWVSNGKVYKSEDLDQARESEKPDYLTLLTD